MEKYKLANGLVVLLSEDHSAPLISYQTWFRVGSKNEEVGSTGIAHLFEHMMFKGAKRYSGEQFDRVLQASGGSNNAGTTQDYTFYYEMLPAGKLELAIDLDSDRMENLRISDEGIKSEREVVKEERRYSVEGNPFGILREAVFGAAFRVHPYRSPIVGSMVDLDSVSAAKATEFFKNYYAPNNAVLAVVGDFKTAEAKALIEKYYGNLRPAVIESKNRPREPMQSAPRLQNLKQDLQNTIFQMAFHAPADGTDDALALDLLANVLGKGPASRLYRRLVYKEEIASMVVVGNETLQDSGLFQVTVAMKPKGDFARAERAIQGEIWRVRNRPVTAAELEAAKNQTEKAVIDTLKTFEGKAEALAINEVVHGDYEELFRELERYERVTPEQIVAAAAKYLAPAQSTLVVVRPSQPRKREAAL